MDSHLCSTFRKDPPATNTRFKASKRKQQLNLAKLKELRAQTLEQMLKDKLPEIWSKETEQYSKDKLHDFQFDQKYEQLIQHRGEPHSHELDCDKVDQLAPKPFKDCNTTVVEVPVKQLITIRMRTEREKLEESESQLKAKSEQNHDSSHESSDQASDLSLEPEASGKEDDTDEQTSEAITPHFNTESDKLYFIKPSTLVPDLPKVRKHVVGIDTLRNKIFGLVETSS